MADHVDPTRKLIAKWKNNNHYVSFGHNSMKESDSVKVKESEVKYNTFHVSS